jgi:N6-adenosine-specific RNA methylase IME4
VKYRTIVVDPPWRYEDKLTMGSGKAHRGAASHYVCASTEDIAAIPVGEWAEDNAHMYLWTTNAFMVEAHDLMAAWGFRQRTIVTWVKTQIGMGHYFRNNTEHVLFGVRGKLAGLRQDLPTAFTAPRGRHSAKPEAFFDLVQSMSPGPYLDVFSRQQRLGWDTWGNECFAIALPEAAMTLPSDEELRP